MSLSLKEKESDGILLCLTEKAHNDDFPHNGRFSVCYDGDKALESQQQTMKTIPSYLKTFLVMTLLMVFAVSAFAQRSGRSGGMGRSGGSSFSSSPRQSYSPPRQSYTAPSQTYSPPRQSGTGGMGRSGAAVAPAPSPSQGSIASGTGRSGMGRTGASTASPSKPKYTYKAPAYVKPTAPRAIGYRYNSIPQNRQYVWHNGGWGYYYPESGMIASLTQPLLLIAAYQAGKSYAPPAGQVPPEYTQTTTTKTNEDGSTTTTTTRTNLPNDNGKTGSSSGGTTFLMVIGVIGAVVVLGVVGWMLFNKL